MIGKEHKNEKIIHKLRHEKNNVFSVTTAYTN